VCGLEEELDVMCEMSGTGREQARKREIRGLSHCRQELEENPRCTLKARKKEQMMPARSFLLTWCFLRTGNRSRDVGRRVGEGRQEEERRRAAFVFPVGVGRHGQNRGR